MATTRGALGSAVFEEPELWRASLATAFSDLLPEQLDREPLPEGTLHGGRLGAIAVFIVAGSPQTVRRSTSAVRHSPSDLLKVCVPLRGRATVHQDDREIMLRPGQLGVYDIARPYELRLEGSWSCAVLAVPRDQLALGPGLLDGAMEHAHLARRGPGRLLTQFISATAAELGRGGTAAAERLSEAGAGLLAGTLTDDGDAAVVSENDAVLDRVTAYIQSRLTDPELSRASVAAAYRMSPRTLDRLFHGQPWPVSGYIRHARLEAVHRDLQDPALRQRSVSALAARWCFFDAAHFSRLFRDHYGYPPSQARS